MAVDCARAAIAFRGVRLAARGLPVLGLCPLWRIGWLPAQPHEGITGRRDTSVSVCAGYGLCLRGGFPAGNVWQAFPVVVGS